VTLRGSPKASVEILPLIEPENATQPKTDSNSVAPVSSPLKPGKPSKSKVELHKGHRDLIERSIMALSAVFAVAIYLWLRYIEVME
jgi:hypothetical protein